MKYIYIYMMQLWYDEICLDVISKSYSVPRICYKSNYDYLRMMQAVMMQAVMMQADRSPHEDPLSLVVDQQRYVISCYFDM